MAKPPVWVICLSGPASNRAKAEIALEHAGIPLLPVDHYAQMDWESKLTPIASAFAVTCPSCGAKSGEHCETRGKPRDDHHKERVEAFERPDPQAFLCAAHPDINAAVAAVEKHGWALRTHHEMPPEPQPPIEQVLTATLDEMRAEIARQGAELVALKAGG